MLCRTVRCNGGCVEACGTEIDCEDGVQVGPDGRTYRQVVTEGEVWGSETWVSEDGTVYQRVFHPCEEEWEWRGPRPLTVNSQGGLLVRVGSGSESRTVRLCRAMAIAYVEPPPSCSPLHAVEIEEGEAHSSRVGWCRPGSRSFESAGVIRLRDAADSPPPSSAFVPLRYVWRSSAGDLLQRFDPTLHGSYAVCREGWIRSPYTGKRTRGTTSLGGRRWASIMGQGFVWLDAAVLTTFVGEREGHVPCKRDVAGEACLDNLMWIRASRRDPPLVRKVREQLREGVTVSDVCNSMCRSSMWTGLALAARETEYGDLGWVRRLVSPLCSRIVERADPFVTLQGLYRTAEASSTQRGDLWHSLSNQDRYGMLQVAIALCLREKWMERERRLFSSEEVEVILDGT